MLNTYDHGYRFGTQFVARYGANAASSCASTFSEDSFFTRDFCLGMWDAVVEAYNGQVTK